MKSVGLKQATVLDAWLCLSLLFSIVDKCNYGPNPRLAFDALYKHLACSAGTALPVLMVEGVMLEKNDESIRSMLD